MAFQHRSAWLRAPILGAAAAIVGACLIIPAAAATQLPPGVTIPFSDAFAPPDKLAAFQAMTFVIDVAPGAGFPLHSHPGKSQVMILQGELTEHKPDGAEKVYHPGDAFIEEPGAVHEVKNTGKDSVRLVWTLLLPNGTEPIMLAH